jgi:hypothetical protein
VSWELPRPPEYFLDRLAGLQRRIRDEVRRQAAPAETAELAAVSAEGEGDTVFTMDVWADEILRDYFARWGEDLPLLLIAEGFPGDGGITFPVGMPRDAVQFTCIVDPIDGTRGLMYQKRSAWVLSAIAPPPTDGPPRLDQIEIAMQTELPTSRSHLSDVLWAVAEKELGAETHDLAAGGFRSFRPQPSRAASLQYGFAAVCKFFPGTKRAAIELEERLFAELLGDLASGNPQIFDDEYICSGGQLYELMIGHDRFIADLRPHLASLEGGGQATRRLCAHPYDLCTELIAREAGVIVTDERGGRLQAPLDIRADCNWIGYANVLLRDRIEPVLRTLLESC